MLESRLGRRLTFALCLLLVLSLVFFLAVLFPPGFRRYGAEGLVGPVLSSISIPPEVAEDLYNLLGPAVGLIVYSPFGESSETIYLAPFGIVGVQPGIHVEPSTVFEMSYDEFVHWSRVANEIVSGQGPKAIYFDAVFSFLFDIKVRPFWKKAGLVALATKYAV